MAHLRSVTQPEPGICAASMWNGFQRKKQIIYLTRYTSSKALASLLGFHLQPQVKFPFQLWHRVFNPFSKGLI